jgi:hypothetical protein
VEGALKVADEVTAVVSEADSGVLIIPRKETDTGRLREERRVREAVFVANVMELAYDENELRDLCFEMGVDYESVSGTNKQGKVRSIVSHFFRRNTLDVFRDFLQGDRPNWSWQLPEEEAPQEETDAGQ